MTKKRFNLKKSLNAIIFTQVVGLFALVLLSNGFMTLWFKKLGIASSSILLFKSVPSLVGLFAFVPLAFLADRFGKKLIGGIGNLVLVLSFLVLALPGLIPSTSTQLETWGFLSYLLISIGMVMFSSSWFGLIGPVIPSKSRGSFFATLRISWQAISIVVTFIVMTIVKKYTSIQAFSAILIISAIALIIRFIPYLSIHEFNDRSRSGGDSFFKLIRQFLSDQKYRLFCLYAFINGCLLGTLITQFILLQTDILIFSDSAVLLTGNIMLLGSILGFYIGGKLTKRLGDIQVMVIGTTLVILMILLPLTRYIIKEDPLWLIGTSLFFIGLIVSANGIGSSSFILAIIPRDNRSFANALNGSFSSLGVTLAGLTTSKLVKNFDLYPVFSLPNLSIYDLFLALLAGVAFCSLPILIKLHRIQNNESI
jgi:MFS family permease